MSKYRISNDRFIATVIAARNFSEAAEILGQENSTISKRARQLGVKPYRLQRGGLGARILREGEQPRSDKTPAGKRGKRAAERRKRRAAKGKTVT